MLKYAKITNEETGLVEIGIGTNYEFYKSIGMEELDVKQSDIDNSWYLAEKCKMKTEEEKQQAERNRLDMLYLTGADVERAIYQVKGLDFDDILTMVKDNPTIDAKALKIEFKANNFYRGNPYISQVGALLGFTSDMLDKFFDTKDYKYLTTCTLTIKPTPTDAIVTGDGVYPYGSEVEYKVEATGYIAKTGTVALLEDTTLEVVLDEDTTDTPRQDSLEGEAN